MNTSTVYVPSDGDEIFNKHLRSINFILSCTGLIFNLTLVVILSLVGRRQCATYFLLILMTICDLLYCTIYVSIILTVNQYINIINHQILCPLSFFLTPFTFTGSILLLFICLLHLITNYVRKYDTIIGQLGGRLSVVFVLAFIIIRSVLGSTSVELVILDQNTPDVQFCTIDTNTPTIVATIQKINHIFAEVTDILIYIGWILILLVHLIRSFHCEKFRHREQNEPSLILKPLSFTSLVIVQSNTNNNNHNRHHSEQNMIAVTMDSPDMLTIASPTSVTITNSKQRHNDVSLIVLSISFISIILYLPIMVSKYLTMYRIYRQETTIKDSYLDVLQLFQHTAHLVCLSIRFLPYFLFDKRINYCLNQMFGVKCMKIDIEKTRPRSRRYKIKHKFIWHCQCYRRQQLLQIDNDRQEQNRQ